MILRAMLVTGALLLPGFISASHAASVTLVPTSATCCLTVGDVISFDINIDFTAEGGTLGGGFDLTFDENQLHLVAFTDTVILGDPSFGRPPDYVPGSGLLESWGVGDFNGLQTGLVGSVSFEILAGAHFITIALGPTNGIAGPWVSAVDFVTIIEPDYNSVQIGYPPLPAAVWFMLSGLAVLGAMRRSVTS